MMRKRIAPSYPPSKHTKYLGVVITYILSLYQKIMIYYVHALASPIGDPVNIPRKTSIKEIIEQMTHLEDYSKMS